MIVNSFMKWVIQTAVAIGWYLIQIVLSATGSFWSILFLLSMVVCAVIYELQQRRKQLGFWGLVWDLLTCVVRLLKPVHVDTLEVLADKGGFSLERHEIETEDGFLCTLHHLVTKQADKKQSVAKGVVLLQHGLFQTCLPFMMNEGNQSLAFYLGNHGYDVWLGNNRGNIFSRKHKQFSSSDVRFWDWSIDDHAKDVRAFLRYMYRYTGGRRINYVGHSNGCAQSLSLFVNPTQQPLDEYKDPYDVSGLDDKALSDPSCQSLVNHVCVMSPGIFINQFQSVPLRCLAKLQGGEAPASVLLSPTFAGPVPVPVRVQVNTTSSSTSSASSEFGLFSPFGSPSQRHANHVQRTRLQAMEGKQFNEPESQVFKQHIQQPIVLPFVVAPSHSASPPPTSVSTALWAYFYDLHGVQYIMSTRVYGWVVALFGFLRPTVQWLWLWLWSWPVMMYGLILSLFGVGNKATKGFLGYFSFVTAYLPTRHQMGHEIHFLFFGRGAFIPFMEVVRKIVGLRIFAYFSHCMFNYLFCWGADLWDPSRFHLYFSQTPAGTSSKTVAHWLQQAAFRSLAVKHLRSRRNSEKIQIEKAGFRMYDFGTDSRNRQKYGRIDPPHYDLSHLRIPVSVFYGGQDRLLDYDRTIRSVPTCVYSQNVPHHQHMDNLMAMDAVDFVFPQVERILSSLTVDKLGDQISAWSSVIHFNDIVPHTVKGDPNVKVHFLHSFVNGHTHVAAVSALRTHIGAEGDSLLSSPLFQSISNGLNNVRGAAGNAVSAMTSSAVTKVASGASDLASKLISTTTSSISIVKSKAIGLTTTTTISNITSNGGRAAVVTTTTKAEDGVVIQHSITSPISNVDENKQSSASSSPVSTGDETPEIRTPSSESSEKEGIPYNMEGSGYRADADVDEPCTAVEVISVPPVVVRPTAVKQRKSVQKVKGKKNSSAR